MASTPSGRHARDVMTSEPVCIEASATLRQLASLLEFHEIGGVPVVGASGVLVGVASLTDVMRRLLAGTDERSPGLLFEVLGEQQDDEAAGDFASGEVPRVEEFRTEDPLTVTEQTPVEEIAALLREHHVHRVIVVDGVGIPVGIVSSLDLLGLIAPVEAVHRRTAAGGG
jgi:CBS domain-containing protein